MVCNKSRETLKCLVVNRVPCAFYIEGVWKVETPRILVRRQGQDRDEWECGKSNDYSSRSGGTFNSATETALVDTLGKRISFVVPSSSKITILSRPISPAKRKTSSKPNPT